MINKKDVLNKLAKNLKKLRNMHGLTQEETAEALNLSLTTYQEYERAKNNIRLTYLLKIAEFFKTSIEKLIE
jgi:transcriptional regulator with XRE-family HTH domain